MSIEVSAFRWVPPFAQGLVRDLRVRWALEEAGLAYGHFAERSEVLLPRDPAGRARAITWMFAALNGGTCGASRSGILPIHSML
jgi:glutathione S-transferase